MKINKEARNGGAMTGIKKVERQKILPLKFENLIVSNAYKVDLLVEDGINRFVL